MTCTVSGEVFVTIVMNEFVHFKGRKAFFREVLLILRSW